MGKIAVSAMCHKYIVRNLKTPADIYVYAKSFMKTMLAHSESYEQVLDMLELSLCGLPKGVVAPDIRGLAPTAEEVYLYLERRQEIDSYSDCSRYYKRYDKGASLCKICPFAKGYADTTEREYAILKYSLKDYDSHQRIASTLPKNFFVSGVDVTDGFDVQTPCVIYVARELYGAVNNSDIAMRLSGENYFPSDIFDIVWTNAFSVISKSHIPSILVNNPRWEENLRTDVRGKLENAPELSEDEIDSIIEGSKRGTRQQIQRNDNVQTTLFDSILVDPGLPEVKGGEGTLVSDAHEQPSSSDPVVNEGNVGVSEGHVVDSARIQHSEDTSLLESERPIYACRKGVLPELPVIEGDAIPLFRIRDLGEWGERSKLLSSEDLPEKDNQGVLRDRFMPVEVVFVYGTGYCYLFYSKYSDTYFFVPIGASSCENFFALLSRNMVAVICYMPFLVQGVCRINGHRAKNVISLSGVMVAPSSETIFDVITTYTDIYAEMGGVRSSFMDTMSASYLFGGLYNLSRSHISLVGDRYVMFGESEGVGRLHGGTLICYSCEECQSLTEYLFDKLSSSADVWRYKLYVYDMDDSSVTFFVADEDYECASTRLEIYVLNYVAGDSKRLDVECVETVCNGE